MAVQHQERGQSNNNNSNNMEIQQQGIGRGSQLTQALQNPWVQNWMKDNPNFIGEAWKNNVQTSGDPVKMAQFKAMQRVRKLF